MVTTKMPDTVQKDENHNVIMPMSIFIFFSYELFACHLYRGQLVAGLLFLVFSFFSPLVFGKRWARYVPTII